MTKAKRNYMKRMKTLRRRCIMRRIFILVPIIILVSIPLFKLTNMFLLRAEYLEAIFANDRILADMIYAERLALDGFLYNLPTFFKAILGLVLLTIWSTALYILASPIKISPKKQKRRTKTRKRAY